MCYNAKGLHTLQQTVRNAAHAALTDNSRLEGTSLAISWWYLQHARQTIMVLAINLPCDDHDDGTCHILAISWRYLPQTCHTTIAGLREHLWVVGNLKRRYRNSWMNEWMVLEIYLHMKTALAIYTCYINWTHHILLIWCWYVPYDDDTCHMGILWGFLMGSTPKK